MKVDIQVNIADVVAIVAGELAKRYPGQEIRSLTVVSWNTIVFQTDDDFLIKPVRHRLDDANKEMS